MNPLNEETFATLGPAFMDWLNGVGGAKRKPTRRRKLSKVRAADKRAKAARKRNR